MWMVRVVKFVPLVSSATINVSQPAQMDIMATQSTIVVKFVIQLALFVQVSTSINVPYATTDIYYQAQHVHQDA